MRDSRTLNFFPCLLHTLEGDKISRALFVLNKKMLGDYTLKRKLKIIHDVSPLKKEKHTNHHTFSSAYLITLNLEFKVLHYADTTISLRCTAIFENLWHPIIEAVGLHLMFIQCENWMHFNYRCSFPLFTPTFTGNVLMKEWMCHEHILLKLV